MATFTALLPQADFAAVLAAYAGGSLVARVEIVGEERDPANCLRTRFRLDDSDAALAAFASWLSGETYVVRRGDR